MRAASDKSRNLQNSLNALVGRIKAAHAAAERADARARKADREALDRAIAEGELLIEAKALLEQQHGSSHGKWLPWIEEHTGIPERTCQERMLLARHKDKYATVADLTVREALKIVREALKLEREARKRSSDRDADADEAGDVDAPDETTSSTSNGHDTAGEDHPPAESERGSSPGEFTAVEIHKEEKPKQFIQLHVGPCSPEPDKPRSYPPLREALLKEAFADLDRFEATFKAKYPFLEGFSVIWTAAQQ
jgi:hypothetical protein